jgi:hypothetical protein
MIDYYTRRTVGVSRPKVTGLGATSMSRSLRLR